MTAPTISGERPRRPQNVAILISGGGSNMAALLADMHSGDHPGRPAVVISNEPGAAGLDRAAAFGAPIEVINHRDFPDREAFETALDAALRRHCTDVVCLAGFMRILKSDIVRRWEGRMINIHPSLLPLFKGLDTHARALRAGVGLHGATAHLVSADLDAGPILGQAAVAVRPSDTEETLAARVLAAEHKLYPAVLRNYLEGEPWPVTLLGEGDAQAPGYLLDARG